MEDFNEDVCMNCSYMLLTGKKTLTQLEKNIDELCFIFNPKHKASIKADVVYETLIDYFITTEEYEKCAEVVKAKKQASL
jgi:hypothetical protein|tara:strand:- start:9116 stop:9355 length:240 start_codon:yes stop_codon:yes gene_type:complete